MDALKELVEISKYAGERYDLIQAGGGNTSVKTADGQLLVKASGVCLSEVSEKSGYVVMDNKKLLTIFSQTTHLKSLTKKQREDWSKKLMISCAVAGSARPSIETLLHARLAKYVLHTHPVVVNAVVCRADWLDVLKQNFTHLPYQTVAYQTPGIELALELDRQFVAKSAPVVFLQNHGLIVTSNDKEEIYSYTEQIVRRLEQYLGVDMTAYKLTNEVSGAFNAAHNTYGNVAYLSQDIFLNTHIRELEQNQGVLFPDKMVYCGYRVLCIKNKLREEIQAYLQIEEGPLNAVIYKGYLFFVAPTLCKAKAIEEVCKAQLLVSVFGKQENMQPLNQEEIRYLAQWEAEKFRRG